MAKCCKDKTEKVQEKSVLSELLEHHTEWFKGLLDSFGGTDITEDTLLYVYRTAFEHGFKHGQEECQGKVKKDVLLSELSA